MKEAKERESLSEEGSLQVTLNSRKVELIKNNFTQNVRCLKEALDFSIY
jgi:hypothetical protein